MTAIAGILFDKDGTLFDFHATWAAWSRRLVMELAGDDETIAAKLGQVIGYDLASNGFLPDSVVVAATPDEIATELLPHLPGSSLSCLVARMNVMAAEVHLQPAVPLLPLFQTLKQRGLRIGLATNDAETAARAHLDQVGIAPFFDFVAGFDSGYGGKPEPGMLLAFATAFALDPAQVVMVGDSRHDLIAGRTAGMRTLAVLTGPADAEQLTPLAETVLPDIGHLPNWLDRQRSLQPAA